MLTLNQRILLKNLKKTYGYDCAIYKEQISDVSDDDLFEVLTTFEMSNSITNAINSFLQSREKDLTDSLISFIMIGIFHSFIKETLKTQKECLSEDEYKSFVNKTIAYLLEMEK